MNRQLMRFLAQLKLQTRFDVAETEDQHHALRPDEHEAFYFLFASADGFISGGLRTLFSPQTVLEIVALKVGYQGWILQQRIPLASRPQADSGGMSLRLQMIRPWQSWEAQLHDLLPHAFTGQRESIHLTMRFVATTPPTLFRLGAYTQVQQDGRMEAHLLTSAGKWEGELISYRDHSWGQRGAGDLPGWMIIDIPQHFYAFILGTVEAHPLAVGRWITPSGELKPLRAPRVMRIGNGWQVSDPRAGFPTWTFERLGPPGISYLGPPGEEQVGSVPMEKALYRDIIGPARFISPMGEIVVGFWDEAVRLKDSLPSAQENQRGSHR